MVTITDFVEDIKINAKLRNEFMYALRNLSTLDELKTWFDQRNVRFAVGESPTLFREIRTMKLKFSVKP